MKRLDEVIKIPKGYSDVIDPTIRKDIEGGKSLPFLPSDNKENEQSYTDTIASDEYKNVIDKVTKYTGVQPNNINPGALTMQMMDSIYKIIDIESKHKKYFEQLAIDVTLQLPIFEKLKEAYENGIIQINANLLGDTIDISQPDELDVNENEHNDQSFDDELFRIIHQLDDRALLRKFSNTVIQGAGTAHFYLFEFVKNKLDKIDPHLIKLYGLVISCINLGYWVMPPGMDNISAQNAAGAENIEIGDDNPTVINASGIIFPVLVHELIKGAMEIPAYIGIASKGQEYFKAAAGEEDSIDNERIQIILGNQIWKQFHNLFSVEEQKYLPAVFQLLLSKIDEIDIKETIKSIFKKGQPSKNVIDELVKIVKEEEQGKWVDPSLG